MRYRPGWQSIGWVVTARHFTLSGTSAHCVSEPLRGRFRGWLPRGRPCILGAFLTTGPPPPPQQSAPGYLVAGPETRAGIAGKTTHMALIFEFLAQQWILVAALLAVVGMLVLHETRKSGPSLSPQQAINLVNAEQGVFLDLRDGADFKRGHIVDALHIPLAKLAERAPELEKYKDRPVVLVCKMGQQSGAAGKQLKTRGFARVYKMSGGMMEWSNLQLPLVK